MYLIIFVVLKDMSLTRMSISISNVLLLAGSDRAADCRRYSSSICGECVILALFGPN